LDSFFIFLSFGVEAFSFFLLVDIGSDMDLAASSLAYCFHPFSFVFDDSLHGAGKMKMKMKMKTKTRRADMIPVAFVSIFLALGQRVSPVSDAAVGVVLYVVVGWRRERL
jgi:hypothetical protein